MLSIQRTTVSLTSLVLIGLVKRMPSIASASPLVFELPLVIRFEGEDTRRPAGVRPGITGTAPARWSLEGGASCRGIDGERSSSRRSVDGLVIYRVERGMGRGGKSINCYYN